MGFFLSPFIYLSIATFIFSPVCLGSVYPVLHFFCAVSSSTSLPVSSSSTSFDENLHNLLCIGFESTWQPTIFAATRSIDLTVLRRLVSMIQSAIIKNIKNIKIFNSCSALNMAFIIMKFPLQIYIISSICFYLCK